ncbi:MAG: hypothetical protein LBS08_03465 [Candidatus Symbiothrix sp.]|jgi:hypothetical protein|nr:hypothetical protein [Candidatus Symbiothrix sp.]
MKKWRIIISSCLFFSVILVQAQEKKKVNGRIGFEFGISSVFGGTVTPDRIRANKSMYEYDDFYCGFPGPDQDAEIIYGGIKYEYPLWENRLGLSAGLRFSKISSEISPDWSYSHFLWLFRQEGQNTDYLSIRSITQKNYYLGVPLELRYFFPRRSDSFFKQYVKLGVAVNYRLSTENSIAFYNNEMTQYADAVGKQVGKPASFNAYVYPAYGFRLGRIKDFWLNLEFQFPGFLAGKKAHSFIRQDFGVGMQMSLQMPLSKIIK